MNNGPDSGIRISGCSRTSSLEVPFLCLGPAADVTLCEQQTGLDALKSQMPGGISASLLLFPGHPSLGWCGGGAQLGLWPENAALAEMFLRWA